MLDKPLVQPPSNLIGFCCLGLCWRPYVRLRPGIPVAFKNHRLIRLLFPVGAGLLILFGIHQSIMEVRVGWHRRMAILFKGHKKNNLAFNHYKKMVELDPTNIKGYYGAGSIALQKLLRPQLALNYLLEAANLDPTYAHLNKLIGKAYGTLGNHSKALPYFEKDCRLFPSDITSLRNYFTCLSLAQCSNLDLLINADKRLKELYIEKASSQLSHSEGRILAIKWLSAVTDGNMEMAINRSSQICRYLDYKDIDPLFYTIFNSASPPISFFYEGFNDYDFEYWQCLVFRKSLFNELKEYNDLEAHQNEDLYLKDIFQYTVNHFIIDSKDYHYESPSVIWSKGKGSSLSYSSLMSWLFRGNRMKAMVYQMDKDPKFCFPIVIDNDKKWYLLDWFKKEAIEFRNGNFFSAAEGKHILRQIDGNINSYGTYKLFFMPQEFLIKNQILSILVNYYLPENQLEFSSVPTIIFYKTTHLAKKIGIDVQIEGSSLQAPITRLIQRLAKNADRR